MSPLKFLFATCLLQFRLYVSARKQDVYVAPANTALGLLVNLYIIVRQTTSFIS